MRQVILIHAHKDLDQLNALVGAAGRRGIPDLRQRRCQVGDRRRALASGRAAGAAAHRNSLGRIQPGRGHPAIRCARCVDEVRGVRQAGVHQRAGFSAAAEPALEGRIGGAGRARAARLRANRRRKAGAAPQRYQYFYRDGGGALAVLACGARQPRHAPRRPARAGWSMAGSRGAARRGGACRATAPRRSCARVARRSGASCGSFAACLVPTRLFFQTLVMNSPFRDRVVREQFSPHRMGGGRPQSEGTRRARLRRLARIARALLPQARAGCQRRLVAAACCACARAASHECASLSSSAILCRPGAPTWRRCSAPSCRATASPAN